MNLRKFPTNQENINGFKYCTILGNVKYGHDFLLTFLKVKKKLNNYYSNTNCTLSSLVREAKPMF